MLTPPHMAPYARHLFICTGQYCDPDGHTQALYEQLRDLLGDLGPYDNPQRVKRGTTPCLGVCAGGPLLVIYPEGIWFHPVDQGMLERIVSKYLQDNQPLTENMFHKLNRDDAPCNP